MNINFFIFVILIISANLTISAAKYSSKTLEHFCQKHPKKWQGYYNLGCYYYQKKDFASAENNFSNALKNCQEPQSQESIFYNLGNTYFQQTNNTEEIKEKISLLEKSIQNYTSTLSLNPEAEDAKHNLEIAKKALEKLKQPNPKDNKNNKNDNSNNQDNSNNKKDQPQQNKPDTSDQDFQNKNSQKDPKTQAKLNQPQENNQYKEQKQEKEMQAILQKAKNDEHILPANFTKKINSNSEEKVLKNW